MMLKRLFVVVMMLSFGVQALAADGAENITCQINGQPQLDTKLGFVLPMPEGFEPSGDPPHEIHSFQSAEARAKQDFSKVSIGISVTKRMQPDELWQWELVESDHPKSMSFEIRRKVIVKKSGKEWFRYAMFNDGFILFVRSVAPMDLNSVLDCFVEQFIDPVHL